VDIAFKFEGTEKFTGGSDAYVRRVKGDIHIKGKDKEVAALRLPAGQWIVSAKAVMTASSASSETVANVRVVQC
jgi:hypothetical protein